MALSGDATAKVTHLPRNKSARFNAEADCEYCMEIHDEYYRTFVEAWQGIRDFYESHAYCYDPIDHQIKRQLQHHERQVQEYNRIMAGDFTDKRTD